MTDYTADLDFSAGEVWKNTVDGGKFGAVVIDPTNQGSYGELTVEVLENGQKLIDAKRVDLAYGARFGPDIDDVATWEQMTIEAVDSHLEGK